MSLGIFILQYNQTALTANLLKVIPEAIVIDNGSTEDFDFGKTKIIRHGSNLGFTAGFMKGIWKYLDKYDSFWLMNNDITITREAVEQVKETAKTVDFFTPSYNCWATVMHNKCEGLRDVGFMEFCAPVISRKVFEVVGLWDSNFSMGYGVEWDFCYRARQKGFKIYVDDRAEFYHIGHRTASKVHGTLTEYDRLANEEKEKVLFKKYGSEWFKILCEGLDLSMDFGRITVYTSIFGGYAKLKPIKKQNVQVEWACVTDQPMKASGWKFVCPKFPRKDLHPRMRAKFFKMFPWEAGILGTSIYIDGSIEVVSEMFVENCIRNLQKDLLLYKHHFCHSNTDEVRESRKLKKYEAEPLEAQVNEYHRSGFEDKEHYSGGVLVRRDTPEIRKLMADWWHENIKWTFHDQISLPYVLWLNNYKPSVFKESINNEYIKIFWHDDHKPEPVAKAVVKPVVKTDEKLVTVLMPCKINDHEILRDAIRSIQRQIYTNWELLIVDDGCGQFVKSYLRQLTDSRIRVIPNMGVGLPSALNTGIRQAKGWLIVRMDADDIAKPELVRSQVAMMGDKNVCGCQLEAFGGAVFSTHHPERVDRKTAKSFLNFWFINHPGVAYRADFIRRYMYAEFYPEDYELWVRILKDGETIYNNPKSLMRYRSKGKVQPGDYKQKLEILRKTL